MINIWVDIVEDMTAEVALKSLPIYLQDLYANVDPESTVSAHGYRWRLANDSNQLTLKNIYYKGGKVSCASCECLLRW
jgi:hypothetical protein